MGRPSSILAPTTPSGLQYFKIFVIVCTIFLFLHSCFSFYPDEHEHERYPLAPKSTPVPSANPIPDTTASKVGSDANINPHGKPRLQPHKKPAPKPITNFIKHGSHSCIPAVDVDFMEHSISKKAVCKKYSPFTAGDARIATVTAQFGNGENQPFQRALKSHMLHSLIHGHKLHVMCDAIIDDLWNKPAFLLNLLLEQMLEPPEKRLEWIFWADRDTIIIDQCRPMSSFLPPEVSKSDWRVQAEKEKRTGEEAEMEEEIEARNEDNKANIIISNDPSGLNNGAFFLRVNNWSIDLLTSILAFRYYRPEVELRFTEQSAMEIMLKEDKFKNNVAYVPQHWFNSYPDGTDSLEFLNRTSFNDVQEFQVRRGDWLVHFAGDGGKYGRDASLIEWSDMLLKMEDVWKARRVVRDVTQEVKDFWEKKEMANMGYDGQEPEPEPEPEEEED